ncbi:MAG: hypothetical protein SGJ02_10335 [bacterium]|nr:hypothetical protein [bacterium]
MKNIKTSIFSALFLSIFFITSCSTNTGKRGSKDGTEKFDPTRFYARTTEGVKTKHIKLNKVSLEKALGFANAATQIRLIELYGSLAPTPRYRVMGFDKMGIYDLLTLQKGDVILAADNFIIKDPALFPTFVNLFPKILPVQKEVSLQVLRGREELLLVYSME